MRFTVKLTAIYRGLSQVVQVGAGGGSLLRSRPSTARFSFYSWFLVPTDRLRWMQAKPRPLDSVRKFNRLYRIKLSVHHYNGIDL